MARSRGNTPGMLGSHGAGSGRLRPPSRRLVALFFGPGCVAPRVRPLSGPVVSFTATKTTFATWIACWQDGGSAGKNGQCEPPTSARHDRVTTARRAVVALGAIVVAHLVDGASLARRLLTTWRRSRRSRARTARGYTARRSPRSWCPSRSSRHQRASSPGHRGRALKRVFDQPPPVRAGSAPGKGAGAKTASGRRAAPDGRRGRESDPIVPCIPSSSDGGRVARALG